MFLSSTDNTRHAELTADDLQILVAAGFTGLQLMDRARNLPDAWRPLHDKLKFVFEEPSTQEEPTQ